MSTSESDSACNSGKLYGIRYLRSAWLLSFFFYGRNIYSPRFLPPPVKGVLKV
ncbi:hypothetical protein BJX96DRAFT_157266, partial [Aspergillus floccosus]